MRIRGRFNGPPGSGHGGYTAGLIAAGLPHGGPVTVNLRKPPPLERDLVLVAGEVRDGDTLIATVEPAAGIADPPPPVTPEVAAAAALSADEVRKDHPFPTCFGCGPDRDDGLALYAGPAGDGRFAAAWTPEDRVDAPLVWAALDCPSSAPAAEPGNRVPIVLARFSVAIAALPRAGEPHAITSRLLSRDGRKRRSAVGLHDADGRCLAHGEALWITLA